MIIMMMMVIMTMIEIIVEITKANGLFLYV